MEVKMPSEGMLLLIAFILFIIGVIIGGDPYASPSNNNAAEERAQIAELYRLGGSKAVKAYNDINNNNNVTCPKCRHVFTP
ncbi:MAG: hypothetical protein WC310_02475 [Patescibacteria group bacterium]|jgi:membrane-bound ClpP family serine protease